MVEEGVGVGRVKEAAEGDGVRGVPEGENACASTSRSRCVDDGGLSSNITSTFAFEFEEELSMTSQLMNTGFEFNSFGDVFSRLEMWAKQTTWSWVMNWLSEYLD
ncbi:hypothetical protein Droror1_Dr00010081 [Drosera rotundifolia]